MGHLLEDARSLGRPEGEGRARRRHVDGAARADPRRADQLPGPRLARRARHGHQELCRRRHHHLAPARVLLGPLPRGVSVVDGRCTITGSEWMDAAEKARKKAEKEASKTKSLDADEKFDAFGNKIEAKQAAKKIPKSELKKIKKQVAALRKQGQEVYTDEEVEKAGYTME